MKIFYGVCGEGMGHAGRSIALIERLVALGHRITVFTFGDAFNLFARSGYRPIRIAGLRFGLSPNGSIATWPTARNFWCFLRKRHRSIDRIDRLAHDLKPDLFITDFEPLTSIVADSLRVPCVSVDNQHRFCSPLNRELPMHLRAYSRVAGQFVRRWIHNPRRCFVAVFHPCPDFEAFTRVDVLLRHKLTLISPFDGDHILLYGRGEIGNRMAIVASSMKERFIAYGFKGIASPNIEYKQTGYEDFACDLASCRAVVCTAGQQLIGEADYFGKPLLSVPIPRQHEQEINAHYARLYGMGDFCSIDQLTCDRILGVLRCGSRPKKSTNGVDQVIELLEMR